MARFDRLVKDVRSSMPEAPASEIERYASRVVVDFCKSSRAWREAVVVPIEAGKSSYPVRIRPEGRLDQVLHAIFVNNQGVRFVLRQMPIGHVSVPGRSPSESSPRYFGLTPDGIRLFPEPGGNSLDIELDPRIEMFVVAVPNRSARQYPDFIHERWYEGLISGVIYMMARLPSKPWTSPELAQIHQREYHQAITNARQSAESGGWTPGRARPPRWV